MNSPVPPAYRNAWLVVGLLMPLALLNYAKRVSHIWIEVGPAF